MIMLSFVGLLLIGGIIVVAKKVSNKLLRYSMITIFSVLTMGIVWIIWFALKSQEM